ncbi:hypothetical protein Tco_0195997 [Tanacetum coccineum]
MHSSSSHKTPSENYKDWLYNQYDEFPGPDSDDELPSKDQYDEFLGLDSDDELPSKVIDNKLPCSILKEMEVLKRQIGLLQEELTMLKSKSNFHDGIMVVLATVFVFFVFVYAKFIT